jgi:hypothetical protein
MFKKTGKGFSPAIMIKNYARKDDRNTTWQLNVTSILEQCRLYSFVASYVYMYSICTLPLQINVSIVLALFNNSARYRPDDDPFWLVIIERR